MKRVLIVGSGMHAQMARMLQDPAISSIVIDCDIALDRIEYPIDGWAELCPSAPRFRRLPPIAPGRTIAHAVTCDPLSRRAARRARGRARAARRAALACPRPGGGSA